MVQQTETCEYFPATNDSKPAVLSELKELMMDESNDEPASEHETLIKEIIALEREYFFEKRNVKAERQRKLRELIERHTKAGGTENGS